MKRAIPLPEVGKFYSVWEKAEKARKWRMSRAFVLLTRVECSIIDGSICVSWQESNSGAECSTSWTSARLSRRYRLLEKPAFDISVKVTL